MSTLPHPSPDGAHRTVGLADGVIEAAALDALAVAVADVDADHILITAHRHLEVHGIAKHVLAAFDERLGAAGLGPAEDFLPPLAEEPPQVGWVDRTDGLVVLGAVTEHWRLSAQQARYAAAIGVPVVFTSRREIVFDGLTEGVAETVVRVLAPLGFIFDASYSAG